MNKEAKKYENKVTYEQMVDFFETKDDIRSDYKEPLLNREAVISGKLILMLFVFAVKCMNIKKCIFRV